MLSLFGLIGLLLAFFGSLVGIAALVLGQLKADRGKADASEVLIWSGRVGALLAFMGLTLSCAILVFAFMTGDPTIQYVLDNQSRNADSLGWLYRLSGLWAGREGSLLFWAWLIALFAYLVSRKRKNAPEAIDNVALVVILAVLAAFVGVLLFSEDNMAFTATAEKYLDYGTGTITTSGSVLGMSSLLEHWAMSIHPPTLFLGYAGLTVPFAYAIAALVRKDFSDNWVLRARPYALFSWLFLTIGIGLGSIWAYVCLGWGGYWGWDPVENASLLSWLMCIALLHSFTAYRQRGSFKAWSIMCAALTFCFVIVGTFISRSGLVQSVHAFEGDPVSLVLFGALMALSVATAGIGLIARRKSLGGDAEEEDQGLLSKDAAYYINCLFILLSTCLLAYMTISSALPDFMPLGGQSVSSGTYNAIGRPLGIVYLALLAIGPLLSWSKTDGKKLLAKLKIPSAIALAVFVALMAFYVCKLLPAYNATIETGGSAAESLLEMGSPLYYNGLAVVGLGVASMLIGTALCMLVRCIKSRAGLLAPIGGSLCHAAMGVMLVGLIGSSMYVTEQTGYLSYDSKTDTSSESFTIQDYELTYTGQSISELSGSDIVYQVSFDVRKNGELIGNVSPSVQLMATTQQQKLNASVISLPTEDLFVVYKGVNAKSGGLSLDVRINPLISIVWTGFILLIVGMMTSIVGAFRDSLREKKERQ